YEQMLRRVLHYDPQNEAGNYLLENLLAATGRWDDLAAHQEKRAYAAPGEADRAILYRRFALEWTQKVKDRERGAAFFLKALQAAYENGADKLPSQVAAFALLMDVFGARKEWTKLLALTDQALAASLGEDEKLYAATLAGGIAWKELGDAAKAKPYFDRVRQIAPESAVLKEFETAAGGAPTAQAPAAPAATPAVEDISPQQKQLMDAAVTAEAQSVDRGIDAWKKAVAADPHKRAPRRELVRVLRKAERWNAVVEALKDEEAKAAKTPAEKVSILHELLDIYR